MYRVIDRYMSSQLKCINLGIDHMVWDMGWNVLGIGFLSHIHFCFCFMSGVVAAALLPLPWL